MSRALVKQELNLGTSYILWLAGFFGFCGIHRFYQGRWISGLVWFFTGGLCGLGQIIDAIMMPKMIDDANAGNAVW